MINSAKELAHYQKVRSSFEAPKGVQGIDDKQERSAKTHGSYISGSKHQVSRPAFSSRNSSKVKDRGKGKGKATTWHKNHEDDDDDDDDVYVTSNDFGSPVRHERTNGAATGKGPMIQRFGDPSEDDDETLYQ